MADVATGVGAHRSPAAHSTSTGAAKPKKENESGEEGGGLGGGRRDGGHPTVTKDVQAAAVSHQAAAAAERTLKAVSPGSAAAMRWGRGRGAGVGGPRAGCQHRGEHQPRRGSAGGASAKRTAQARLPPRQSKRKEMRGSSPTRKGGAGVGSEKSPLSSLCVAPPPNGVSRRRGEVASPCRRSRPRAVCHGGRREQSWPLGRRRRQPRRAPKRGGSGHSTGVGSTVNIQRRCLRTPSPFCHADRPKDGI